MHVKLKCKLNLFLFRTLEIEIFTQINNEF